MSSEKIHMTTGIKKWIVRALDEEAKNERRSRSSWLEMILEKRYEYKEGSIKGENNGDEA